MIIDVNDNDAVAMAFAQICSDAAVEVMAVYESDFEVRIKDDRSPVSDADERAEKVILTELARLMPGVPVVAEESFSAGERVSPGEEFILVDPVDGTREFIARNGEFTLNIALVRGGAPVAGVVYAPALGRVYAGGETAWSADLLPGDDVSAANRETLDGRPLNPKAVIAICSRSHRDEQTTEFLAAIGVSDTVSAGSSLKFCLLAEGRADIYPRFGPTCEWDIAAGQAVLCAAGGGAWSMSGEALQFGKVNTDFLNGAFVAWADGVEGRRLLRDKWPCD